MQLLEVESEDGAWSKLISGAPQAGSAIGYQLVEAVLNRLQQLELEIKLADAGGVTSIYGWCCVCPIPAWTITRSF